MMSKTVKEGDDTGSIGKDGVPVAKRAISSDENGGTLVAAIDDFEEEIGGIGVIGEIADLINAKKRRTAVESQFGAAQGRGVTTEI